MVVDVVDDYEVALTKGSQVAHDGSLSTNDN